MRFSINLAAVVKWLRHHWLDPRAVEQERQAQMHMDKARIAKAQEAKDEQVHRRDR